MPALRTDLSTSTGPSAAAGSPGPLEKKTPSGWRAEISAKVAVDGTTCTSMPRSAIRTGVIDLMPRSTATTRNDASPSGRTTYRSLVETSSARWAPLIAGCALTRSSRAPASVSTLETPTRIAPRSRRCRVSARVSTSHMPTTPWALSSSSRLRRERQLEDTRAGSRTTYPATQICPDSSSSSFQPVLPMCGAVAITTCR